MLCFNSGTEPGFGVRGAKIFKKKIETPNKRSFNKLSIKKNTQNYFFLRYCNTKKKIEIIMSLYSQ